MRIFALAVFVLSTFSHASVAQKYPGSIADGYMFALEMCSECHVVAADQDKPATDAVPTFTAIAADPAVTEISLRAFLQTPHAEMPNFILSRIQTDNIISYILSLRD